MISNTKNGRIAEYIAGASLEEQGFSTAFCQQDGIDIFAFKDDHFYRVQVKGSLLRKTKGYLHHQFQLGIGGTKRKPDINDYDLCALVSLYERRCFYLPIEKLNTQTIRKTLKVFENKNIEEETLKESLKIIHKRKYRKKLKWKV
tara:strand:- start:468 stop:902 length:435 start_codon:yes stop_codon:yes gene_type:complete